MERYKEIAARHPRAAQGIGVSGGLLTIVGLAGVPADLENWGAAFQAIGSELGRWIVVMAGLLLIAATVYLRKRPGQLGPTVQKPRGRSPVEPAEPVFTAAEAEIALAREEALEMAKLLRVEWPYISVDGALVQTALPDWRAKTTEFIGTVLGAAQRAAFKASETGSNVLERLESEGRFLERLATTISAESIRTDEADFLAARRKRRDHDAARFLAYEHHRAPNAPPPAREPAPDNESVPSQFGRRDDRGELAKRCHMLAGSVERWVESFSSGRSERVERLVREMLEADAELDPAEARRKARTRDEKTWELDYRLKYGEEARIVFQEAWELHEVAKEHEQLAVAPLAVEFEEVPKLFNEIADRLYRVAA